MMRNKLLTPRALSGKPFARAGAAGFSLVEVLISAALLLVVAIGIIPLFMKAMESNLRGLEGSEVTNYGRAEVERALSLAVDWPSYKIEEADSTEIEDVPPDVPSINTRTAAQLVQSENYWFTQRHTPTAAVPSLGDGDWVAADFPSLTTYTNEGLVLFQRRLVIRQYAYSDISSGVLDVDDPTVLIQQGDPFLFDQPYGQGYSSNQMHLREFEAEMTSLRSLTDQTRRTRLTRLF